MLLSYNWLKEYLELNMSPAELADRLNMSGIPIEEVIEKRSEVSGVFAAGILSVEKHPNADNLSLCNVTDGKEQFKIVCGAKNIAPGQVVPLAKEGAALPGGVKIKKTTIRGVESSGMLCSAKELGIAEDHSGILILNPEEYKPGQPYIPFQPDTILSLEITPNRPDLLCMTGIARFIAALTGRQLKSPSCEINKNNIDASLDINPKFRVLIKDPDRCPRYTARLIEGVKVRESPAWIRERLSNAGIRPINNIVDVTNYVMLELNQPLHAFDFSKIKDAEIIVRTARKGEKITALDGKLYELKETDLVIADSKEPIAIGGVMGGEHFSIDQDTMDVILESAFFSPKSIRKTSRALGISSDSSYRFERGIDIDNVNNALNRAIELIIEISGGRASRNIIDVYPEKFTPKQVTLRFGRANKLLGVSITENEIIGIIKKLNFTITSRKPGSIVVEIPAYRVDISREIDLIEDIAQIYGYDNIPTTMPVSVMSIGTESRLDALIKEAQKLMAGSGFSEVKNYSFFNNKLLKDLKHGMYSPDAAVNLKNPFNEEETRMKTTLLPDLIKNLITNHNNENENIHLFEIADVYRKIDDFYEQLPRIGAITNGYLIKPSHNHKELTADFTFIKSVVQGLASLFSPGKETHYEPVSGCPFYEFAADITVDGTSIGNTGQLKDDILYDNKFKDKAYMFELDLNTLLSMASVRVQYVRFSRFPAVKRDLSIIIKSEIPEAKVETLITGENRSLIKSLDLYDLYRGGQVPEGCKSLTYSIQFQSDSKTLSEDDINTVMSGIITRLKTGINAELRS
jgi:phenylalanyl-tRNA synthetase beta chain